MPKSDMPPNNGQSARSSGSGISRAMGHRQSVGDRASDKSKSDTPLTRMQQERRQESGALPVPASIVVPKALAGCAWEA